MEKELRCYLECGIPAHGFARAVCDGCGDELRLPFSCKLRGICPSCNGRRMSNTAAHLIERVIAPDVTLRQWVMSVPFELRLLLAAKPDALSAIRRIFLQELQRWQREQARALGLEPAEGAAVSFCQRFGSSLNLNVHWHVIVPDAVFLPDATGKHPGARALRAPTRLDLEEIVTAVALRSVRWLEQHGYVRGEGEEDPREEAEARSPWLRFYGVWAPHSRWRSLVVPAKPELPEQQHRHDSGASPAASGAGEPCASCATPDTAAPSTTARPSASGSTPQCATREQPRSPSAAAVVSAAAVPHAPAVPLHGAAEELRFRRLSRLAWATLYQRVFDIDPLECSGSGGRLRFVEVIEDPVQARSELQRRNLPAEPPRLGRARAPDWVA